MLKPLFKSSKDYPTNRGDCSTRWPSRIHCKGRCGRGLIQDGKQRSLLTSLVRMHGSYLESIEHGHGSFSFGESGEGTQQNRKATTSGRKLLPL